MPYAAPGGPLSLHHKVEIQRSGLYHESSLLSLIASLVSLTSQVSQHVACGTLCQLFHAKVQLIVWRHLMMLVLGTQYKDITSSTCCIKTGTITASTYVEVDNIISIGPQLHVAVHMQLFGVVRLCLPRQGQTCQLWLSTWCKVNRTILMSSQEPTQLPDPCNLLLELQR